LDSIYLIASEFLKGETSLHITSRDRVFLDIGAHYGLVSARIASSVNPTSRIIAIEPHPTNYRVLKQNMELNHLINVAAFNFAVTNFTGTSRMVIQDHVSAQYKLADENRAADSPFEVPCFRLRDAFDRVGIDHADLAKLDIEGQELNVLQDCLPALADKISKLDVEVHHPEDLAPLQNLLVSNGFVVQIQSGSLMSKSYRIIAEKIHSSHKPVTTESVADVLPGTSS
jgi:FkbM family methyltransferase